jgi:hypothetical protein
LALSVKQATQIVETVQTPSAVQQGNPKVAYNLTNGGLASLIAPVASFMYSKGQTPIAVDAKKIVDGSGITAYLKSVKPAAKKTKK